jgi:large subunit ribosomal protein L10
MDRAQKAKEIQDMNARLKDSELVILVHNKGITHAQDMELRNALRKEGASYKVAKNTLTKLALKGTKFEGLSDKLIGPVGIATSKDPIAAARITYGFVKGSNEKMEIIGGANDTEILSLDKIKFLATLPSMDGLRGKIVGLLQAPGAQLARLANAYATKDQA